MITSPFFSLEFFILIYCRMWWSLLLNLLNESLLYFSFFRSWTEHRIMNSLRCSWAWCLGALSWICHTINVLVVFLEAARLHYSHFTDRNKRQNEAEPQENQLLWVRTWVIYFSIQIMALSGCCCTTCCANEHLGSNCAAPREWITCSFWWSDQIWFQVTWCKTEKNGKCSATGAPLTCHSLRNLGFFLSPTCKSCSRADTWPLPIIRWDPWKLHVQMKF